MITVKNRIVDVVKNAPIPKIIELPKCKFTRKAQFSVDFKSSQDFSNVRFIEIFTNRIAKLTNKKCNWLCYIVGDEDCPKITNIAYGYLSVCECSSCEKESSDVLELIALIKGLEWVKTNTPNADVTIYYESDYLNEVIHQGRLLEAHRLSDNRLLNYLSVQLHGLMSGLAVYPLQYAYKNKDMIPSYYF